MKPFQVIIMVVCGLLALAGLLVFTTSTGVGGGSKQVGTVAVWGTLPQEGMDAALEALQLDPRFTGVTYREVDEQSFSGTLAQAIAEGRGPDLLILSQEELLSESGKLSVIPSESLPVRDFLDSYVPMSELFLGSAGAYGVPFLVDPLVLYYDKPKLLSAGLSSAPATWEAVTALAESLSRVSQDRQAVIESAIPFGDYANVANARAIISMLLLQAGTQVTATTESGFRSVMAAETSTGAVPAEAAVSFYTQFANPSKTVYSWNRSQPRSTDAFVAGTLAMYPGFASERAFLAASNPNLEFDMARIPQPAVNGNRTTYAKLYAISILRSSANPAGASETAFALAAPDPSLAAASALSMAPALSAYLIPPGDDRYAAIYYPEALVARGWLMPAPGATDGILSGMISNITSGRSDLMDAVRAASDSIDAMLP